MGTGGAPHHCTSQCTLPYNMQSLIVFSLAMATAFAATPFFESPHNEKASAFYKAPAHGGPAPYRPAPAPYKPAPAPYQPAPAYSAPAPAYKPAPAPAYKPEPYKPYKSEYSSGATSYQNVKLEVGQQEYRQPEYKPQYKPSY